MRFVCINNVDLTKNSKGKTIHKKLPLTIGQTYEVELKNYNDPFSGNGFYSPYYTVICDDKNDKNSYHSSNFVTLDVWREMQLNKLI
jgi:hypothetical protein